MTRYTIQILNNSGYPKNYVIFSDPPNVGNMNITIFTNAWITFNTIDDGSYDQVIYDDQIYASWGTTSAGDLEVAAIVSYGGSVPVQIATKDGVTFAGERPAGFGQVSPNVATPGSYRITSQDDFNISYGYVFGMSKLAQTPIAVPLATFQAEPGENYDIYPGEKLYAAEGAFTEGEVINFGSLSAKAAVIDFTARPQTTATVVQNGKGTFSVSYS